MTTISKLKSSLLKIPAAIVAMGLFLSILIVSCQKPAEKVETAKENVAEANQDLKEAKREVREEWKSEWLTLKRDTDEDIADNERRIIDLRNEVNAVDARYRTKYNTRIDELEVRNIELRDRVNNVKDEGDTAWEQFKKDTKRDVDKLKGSLKNINIKNG